MNEAVGISRPIGYVAGFQEGHASVPAVPKGEPKPICQAEPCDPADTFRQARQARRLELVEDYVELIADLIDDTGEARQVDIAQRLGVAQPTVAKMLKRLVAGGLVVQRPYRGVFLTPSGQELAEMSRARHQIVEAFLRAVGVSPDTARMDAEGIEHHASDETLEVFRAFVARTR